MKYVYVLSVRIACVNHNLIMFCMLTLTNIFFGVQRNVETHELAKLESSLELCAWDNAFLSCVDRSVPLIARFAFTHQQRK